MCCSKHDSEHLIRISARENQHTNTNALTASLHVTPNRARKYSLILLIIKYFRNDSFIFEMNRKFISILLCCWPEDLFDGNNDIWSNRKIEDALIHIIRNGDFESLIKIFDRGYSLKDMCITVYRKNLQHLCNCWLDHNSKDSIVYFYQESSPLLWAVDCHQWDLLRAMIKRGINPNKPIVCRRWTNLYSKVNVVPYTKSWTRGKCTYQSVLDYYLASIYEVLLDNTSQHTLSDYSDYFEDLVDILQSGVDVHRIDSIIIFNLLAASFDMAIRQYNLNEHICVVSQMVSQKTIPLKPQNYHTKFIELKVFINLIENGFSQLDFIEYLNPCYNWFGILICLLSHPTIDSKKVKYQQNNDSSDQVPSLIKDAALLLINLLAMRNIFSPTFTEFEDNYDNLNLRKYFVKQYTDQRIVFTERVEKLKRLCSEQKSKPLKLKFLARTVIRKRLGGVKFLSKLKRLELPRELEKFISYINISHLKSTDFPNLLINMALGNHSNYQLD